MNGWLVGFVPFPDGGGEGVLTLINKEKIKVK